MSVATIAVYSLKGGVGKTTFAVNLASAAASVSKRRTLLWDLDPQAASTWLVSLDDSGMDEAQAIFSRDVDIHKLIRPTKINGVDLVAADTSLRGLDRLFYDMGKKRRLAKLIEGLDKSYERIVLDCPPGLTETSEQVLRAADIIIVPVIPSPLAERALLAVANHLDEKGGRRAAILPVFSMVDRRRGLHRTALADQPNWPAIPMASAVEQMTVKRSPLDAFAANSQAAQEFARLWTAIERKLAKNRQA